MPVSLASAGSLHSSAGLGWGLSRSLPTNILRQATAAAASGSAHSQRPRRPEHGRPAVQGPTHAFVAVFSEPPAPEGSHPGAACSQRPQGERLRLPCPPCLTCLKRYPEQEGLGPTAPLGPWWEKPGLQTPPSQVSPGPRPERWQQEARRQPPPLAPQTIMGPTQRRITEQRLASHQQAAGQAARKQGHGMAAVSYTHLTLPTTGSLCRSRWSPYH